MRNKGHWLRTSWMLICLLLGALFAQPGIAVAAAAEESAGSIRYDVHFGAQGFKVGEAVHRWAFSAQDYTLELDLKATGVVGLFGLEYRQFSAGKLAGERLQPQRFRVEQRGRKPEEARFDWSRSAVDFYRGERQRRTAGIAVGDQDVLSLWHQAGRVARQLLKAGARSAAPAAAVSLQVATARKLKPASLSLVGQEKLTVPAGEFDSLRLLLAAEDGGLEIELWLASAHDWLPLRIRLTDDDGQVLDQRATALSLDSGQARSAEHGK